MHDQHGVPDGRSSTSEVTGFVNEKNITTVICSSRLQFVVPISAKKRVKNFKY